jgi:hypothetical protein
MSAVANHTLNLQMQIWQNTMKFAQACHVLAAAPACLTWTQCQQAATSDLCLYKNAKFCCTMHEPIDR